MFELIQDNPDSNNHDQQPSICLDENGFPQHEPIENSIGCSKDDTFAAEFYRSGSDWSILSSSKNGPNSSNTLKKMKQTNLFQLWGFKGGNKSHGENEQIVTTKNIVTQVDCVGSSSIEKRKSRPCPFYKKIPGTPFTVDAFRYGSVGGCSAYFLTHFHADHYGGLSKGWSHGRIYCTSITARLVRMCLYVNPSYIRPLELNVEHDIDGVKVTMLEANHCPGAALIHFRLPDGQCFLHTGDFRACKHMQTYPLLLNKQVDVLYLDTTYCNPKYRFPSKEEVTSFVVKTTKACLKKQPRTLIIVGAYSIGKESVYITISEALGVKIYANASRRRILQSFDWPHLSKRLCSDGKDTPLHVIPISSLRHETLKNYLKTYQDQFTSVLAFRPTGWTFSESIGNQLDLIKPNSRGNIQVYGVPYSEHSSFTELQEFVQFLKPKKIIATVNISNAAAREKQQSYFRQWLNGQVPGFEQVNLIFCATDGESTNQMALLFRGLGQVFGDFVVDGAGRPQMCNVVELLR